MGDQQMVDLIKALPYSEIENLYAQGLYQESLERLQGVIKNNPRDIRAIELAAASFLALNNRDQARNLWLNILEIKPNHISALIRLALLAAERNKPKEAEEFYRQALSYAPKSVEVQNNFANFLQSQGRMAEAEIYYKSSIELCPQLPNVHSNYGIFLKKQERYEEAEAFYLKAIELNPGFIDAHSNLGNMYLKVKRYPDAEKCYNAALKLNPDSYALYNNLGQLNFEIKNYDKAEGLYRKALQLKPDYAEAHFDLANLLSKKNRYSEAEAEFRKAILSKLDYVDAYINLGSHLYEWNRLDEAKESLLTALKYKPDCVDAYHNLALCFIKNKNWDSAEQHFRIALSIKPDYVKSKFNLGFLLLLMGRLEEGWPLYEYRCDPEMGDTAILPPQVPFPKWQGQNLKGKSLLVLHEQGFGDVIEFTRYIPLLKKIGADRITMVCQKPLRSLLNTLDGVDKVLCSDEPVPQQAAYNFWTFLVSIPLHLKTSLATIPSQCGYFSIPHELESKWSKFLPKSGLKVGLVWKGSLSRVNDQRSLSSLHQLRPLWSIPDISFVSLQKKQKDGVDIVLPEDQPICHLGDLVEDFIDSAAILKQLDLLITVDTAIAHLAGALGIPVWVLLPYTADWRWLLDRSDNPWYPSMRLFRQQKQGQWQEVIEMLTRELHTYTIR